MSAVTKLRPTKRPSSVSVRWCLNENCALHGEEVYEKACTRCDTKPTLLKWTLVLCEPRGVYMGLVAWPKGELPKALTLYLARSCVMYQGIGSAGLAAVGPNERCRITGSTMETSVANPKSLHALTPEALSRWEDEPWSK
jgi:hypothetical protein